MTNYNLDLRSYGQLLSCLTYKRIKEKSLVFYKSFKEWLNFIISVDNNFLMKMDVYNF